MMSPGPSPTEPRYVFVDGLRGLAALAVVGHHLLECTVMGPALGRILPGPLQFLCERGLYGVQVFFVISGFVIAHSLRRTEPTARAIGNFIVRRQLRLDLPYWAALAVVLAGTALEAHLPGLTPRTLPTVGNVLANMGYLQNLLGATQVLGVAWTLCLEVQFYLVFIAILACGRGAVGAVTVGPVPLLVVALVGGLGLVSLGDRAAGVVAVGWFLPFWFYFAAGVLCYWHFRGRLHAAVFWGFVGAFALAAGVRPGSSRRGGAGDGAGPARGGPGGAADDLAGRAGVHLPGAHFLQPLPHPRAGAFGRPAGRLQADRREPGGRRGVVCPRRRGLPRGGAPAPRPGGGTRPAARRAVEVRSARRPVGSPEQGVRTRRPALGSLTLAPTSFPRP